MDDPRTQRWQRISRADTDEPGGDPIGILRKQIAEVRSAPRSFEPRRKLRAVAADLGAWEPLAMLLVDEAGAAAGRPDLAAAFYEELADCYENLDQPNDTIAAMQAVIGLQPTQVSHHERLAWLFRRAGKWEESAAAYAKVGELGGEEAAYKALRAAARLYRDHGRAEDAAAIYRKIVARRPNDLDAWRALDELYGELKRWDELALVREELAGRTENAIDRAAMLRAQARALTEAGDVEHATSLLARVQEEAVGEVSGVVDQVIVLAQLGKGREAAAILRERVAAAVRDGAAADDLAALRARLAAILEDAVGDRAASAEVLEELLAESPGYLPALERLVWQASHDPDPRVHAVALVKQAAALKTAGERRAVMLEAARKFREAGDHKSAVRAYEKVVELGGAEDVGGEVAAAKATLAVELARADLANGDPASAERRLRAIVEKVPGDLDANLALAEVLAHAGRTAEARDAIKAALVETPDEAPPDKLARLVFEHAKASAALGDADEAHQMLHEAHHLARRDLPITLALGESCYARKLWREATIHLGGLAEHPEAVRHASAVAVGLAKAAQAEVRSLRPQNAAKHLTAALALDGECAPALHALAEIAIENGDTAKAAGLLEREARATVDPEKQLRLWDALGDLAEGLLGDRARAERCWVAVVGLPLVGDAALARVPVLDKLLLLQRASRSPALGETCMALAAVVGGDRWKDLVVEGARAFVSAGDLMRAREVAAQVVERFPHDARAVDVASEIAIALADMDAAKSWLRPALAAWEARGARSIDSALVADLWRRLGDAERARGNEASALAAYQKGVNAAPDSPGATAARRGLVELASGNTGTSGSQLPQFSVATSLAALVEAEHDPQETLAYARGLATRSTGAAADNLENARAAYELAIALGVTLEPNDRAFLVTNVVRPMAADQGYAATLDPAERRALVDDDADAPLAELLEMLWEVAPQLAPTPQSALFEADASDAKRLSGASDAAAVAMYPQIAKLFGGPAVLLHAAPRGKSTPDRSHLDALGGLARLAYEDLSAATRTPRKHDVRVLFASPPVVVLPAELVQTRARTVSEGELERDRDAELRFAVGRAVERTRPRRIFAAQGDDTFARMLAALASAFGPPSDSRIDAGIAREAERLRGALPVALRKRVTDKLATIPTTALDATAYIAGCERAADRAGLLACGRIDIAIATAGGAAAAPHLVELAAMQKYLISRRRLRPRR